MKTAMQEFICYLEDGGQIFDPELIKEYLEKEKQQTISFSNKCRIINEDNASFLFTPELEFDRTFKND